MKKALAIVAMVGGTIITAYGLSSPDITGLFASVFGMFTIVASIEYVVPDGNDNDAKEIGTKEVDAKDIVTE